MSFETAPGRNAGKNTAKKRAVGYFRVSSEEQIEGYSIAAQERAYRQYAETQGYISVGEYKDEGKSARTDNIRKRPQFAKMLQDAQDGLFDTIIVHKMDRFSRSLRVAVQTFEILGKSNVGLASISEPNLDYSTPQGKLFMHMLWALAQFYSDNLSQETKKGKNERRLQGLYNGTIPFGTIKDPESGIPVPDKRDIDLGDNHTNYDGLLFIFEMAAEGETCKTIAEELNRTGYRSTGNRGKNLFTKDTINAILRNRFYLGELPDGDYSEGRSRRGHYSKGIKGKQNQLISPELWEAAQRGIESNRGRVGRPVIVNKAKVYSLSGLLECGSCGGKLHIHTNSDGKARIYCYQNIQGVASECKQRSSFLSLYEEQIEQYLSDIRLPANFQQIILEAYNREDEAGPGFEKQRKDLENRLKRMQTMFAWGDLPEKEYKDQRDQIKRELTALPKSTSNKVDEVERLASYIRNVGQAWRNANPEQRNKLAKILFRTIEVEDKKIKGVTPQIEYTPLLVLNHLEHVRERQGKSLKSGSDGVRSLIRHTNSAFLQERNLKSYTGFRAA